MNSGEVLETVRLFQKWWKTWRTLPVFSWVRAAALYRKGDFYGASIQYELGLKRHLKHPARFCARLDLAHCYYRLGRLLEAERELKSVIFHSPTLREGYIRLAQLQVWIGKPLEAAWTMRRALRQMQADADLVAVYILSLIESDGPIFLLKEASTFASQLSPEQKMSHRMQLATARLYMREENYEEGRALLTKIATSASTSVDALIVYAEMLLNEGKIAHARQQLRRAMSVSANHPRVLSLFAITYLKAGPFYNPEFARQLATLACQQTRWESPREMHVLAESCYHVGDKAAALLSASKARDAGSRLLNAYRDSKTLDKLIESLSSSTLA